MKTLALIGLAMLMLLVAAFGIAWATCWLIAAKIMTALEDALKR